MTWTIQLSKNVFFTSQFKHFLQPTPCFQSLNLTEPVFRCSNLQIIHCLQTSHMTESFNFHIWFWIGWHEPYIIHFEFANCYGEELLSYVFANKTHLQLPDCKFHIWQSPSIFTYGFELDNMNHTLFILNFKIVMGMNFSHIFLQIENIHNSLIAIFTFDRVSQFSHMVLNWMTWTTHYLFWICKLLSGWTSLICFRK